MSRTTKKPKLVEVEWLDTYSADPWQDKETALEMFPEGALCSTIGYYLRETKAYLYLAATLGMNDTIAGMWAIPKGMIKKRRVIR